MCKEVKGMHCKRCNACDETIENNKGAKKLMNPVKVEIGRYKVKQDKGALKGFFSVNIHLTDCIIQLNNCSYFVSGEKRWINLPQETVKYTDGRKTDYFPLALIYPKEKADQIKDAILEELKNAKPQDNYGKKENQATSGQTNPVQSDASAIWFG